MKNQTFFTRYSNLIPFLVLWLLAIYFFQYPKGEVVLLLNRMHSPALDFVFTKLSSIGNALSIFFFLAIVLWKYELKFLYFFVLAFLLESLVIIVCKNVFFSHEPRPYLFFEAQGILDQVDLVEGVKINKRRSFPSGHTAYSFCMATFFALKFNKKYIAFFLAIFAAFVGMSRMYLVQHFFVDVFTGAFVGTVATAIAYFLVFRTEKDWYNKRVFTKK
ncbi:phosphatase PAP2 family protein [Wenyingzhuangia sp. IMCC45574]